METALGPSADSAHMFTLSATTADRRGVLKLGRDRRRAGYIVYKQFSSSCLHECCYVQIYTLIIRYMNHTFLLSILFE